MKLSSFSNCFLYAMGLLVCLPQAYILRTQWQDWRACTTAGQALDRYEVATALTDQVMAEYEPTGMVLVHDTPAHRNALSRARQTTDSALRRLTILLDPVQDASGSDRLSLATTRRALDEARTDIDSLAMGKEHCEDGDTQGPLQYFTAVIDTLQPPMIDQAAQITQVTPGVYELLTGANQLSLISHYARQLRMQLIPALTTGCPITHAETDALLRLRGQIEEHHKALVQRLRPYRDQPALEQAYLSAETRYFNEALSEVDDLLISHRDTIVDKERFQRVYNQGLGPLGNMRSVMLQLARQQIQRQSHQALIMFYTAVAASMATLGLLLLVGFFFRHRVLNALADTNETLKAFARGHFNVPLPDRHHHDEIGETLHALAVLRANNLERLSLQEDRERLISQLRQQAETDFLTGLANRQATQRVGRQMLAAARRGTGDLSLILFDIDNFKQINDQYGHAVGDQVLALVAALCKEQVRQSDLIGRHGGEEFLILSQPCSLADATAQAERLRAALEACPLRLPDSAGIPFTASFGVATLNATQNLDQLIHDADSAMYEAKKGGRNRVCAYRHGAGQAELHNC
ncbi:GGDEF domain-containing protein [Chitiniphilus eburneus]|uniref:diguanylate cyclase n=1 Tax=Chitiniphilus eburneus TaxID=2571148 RepID=A0A4U0Q1Q0_9NEIS|nr:GGDEF domain-containing protein [Chitiniphilus eburneus]TJZ74839.1 GGDEF domain-containing protein [Chitiniphilus eburneus]